MLYRCGIAHNWAGVITRTTHELAAAETRLTEGLRISSSIPSDRSRFNLALSNTLINRYEWHGNAPDLDAALATAKHRGFGRESDPAFRLPVRARPRAPGVLLRNRYLRLRRREDIDTAVQLLSGELNDDDHRDPARLTNLGNALLIRFEPKAIRTTWPAPGPPSCVPSNSPLPATGNWHAGTTTQRMPWRRLPMSTATTMRRRPPWSIIAQPWH